MIEKRRFVKSYRFGHNFHIWEAVEENGETSLLSGCERVYETSSGKPPRCDGLNEFGYPCPYVTRVHRSEDN